MKRWIKYLLAVIVALAVVGICHEARGQSEYMQADFSRSDAWPRSGLRGYWRFDMGVQGDSLEGEGSFEIFTGPEGGCTNCATGWGCACTSGDVDQESTIIYDLDHSIAVEPGGAFQLIAYQTMTFEANECYQLSWCHYGEAGTEDFAVVATNASLTDVYDWSTDTWGGGPTTTFINVPASWTCQRFNLRNGPVEKADYWLGLTVTSADGTNVFVDQFRVERLNACDVTGFLGNMLSNPATSDPLWGHSEVLLPRVGTGPAYKTGMKTDGVDDHLLCADADCPMDPILWASGGSFSVGCRVMTDTVAAGTDFIISKWTAAGAQRSWFIQRNGADLVFTISDDGTNTDTNNVGGIFTVDALHSFVSTWDPSGGAAAYENNLYYDAYQVDTDATMTEGVPFNSTAALQIGAVNSVNTWIGPILECALWERKLSAVEANKFISPYFPGNEHGSGGYVDTCSQAASHATCSTQICRNGTPNECQAEGTGVQACFGQTTEQLDNNYFGDFTGDDSDPTFTGWTKTGAVTAYRADKKHGSVSARMKRTGSDVSLTTSCVSVSASTAYYAFADAKNISGDPSFVVEYDPYTSADCTTGQQTTVEVSVGSTESVWTETGDTKTTAVGINSLKLRIRQTTDGSAIYDTVSLKTGSYRTPFIPCPSGSAPCTATSRQYELHNPLSDFIEAEQKFGYEDGFCAAIWVWTPWANDGAHHYIFHVPGTAGNNNVWHVRKLNTDDVYFYLYDSAGNTRYVRLAVTDTNWTAGNWKYVEVCSNNSDNVIAGRFYNVANSTWYDLAAIGGVGTGIQDGQSSDLHVGHNNNTLYLDGYIPKIHISPYPTGNFVWPLKGWNNGRPPVNGRPY